ncbi:MAG TPA: tyrosine-type recombinase/integrase [Patescibacteria group bacterium]|nr:tyrosine-type recombinase/integrase [Patescibacteria group bacterium]
MPSITLQLAQTQFVDFLKEKARSNATIVAYKKDIDQLTSFLSENGKKEVDDIKKDDIEGFLSKLSGSGYTPKSLSRKINSIRTFYRFLKAKGLVSEDPSLQVAHPQYQLAAPRILTPTEYRALRDASRNDVRMFAVIELLLQTGIRIGELAELRLSDVKEDGLVIRPFEKHEERTVPMNKSAKEALDRYLKSRPEVAEERIFVTKSGRPFLIRNIRTAVERYFRLAEIKGAKVNDLRHTFIAHHLKHGVSLVLLSKIVGHKRLSTTERYLEFVPDRAKENSHLTEL